MRMRITGLLLALGLLLTAAGCSSDSTVFIGSIENSTAVSWANNYVGFSGHASRTITVREGSPVEVFVDITTEAGTLGVTILGKDGTSCYEGNALETASFSVTLEKPGDYDITVTAKNHKGGFSFVWG